MYELSRCIVAVQHLLKAYTAFSARRYGWGAVVALSSPPSGAKDPGECRTDLVAAVTIPSGRCIHLCE
jgi:hypothetical protein